MRRSRWVDPRLVTGIVLVVASIVGVCVLVAVNDHRVPVYVARMPLSAGETVRPENLGTARLALDSGVDRYVSSAAPLKGEFIVRRAVGAGELLPAAALAPASESRASAVVIELDGPRAESVDRGAIVDVWAAPAAKDGRFQAPTVIAGGVSVLRVVSHQNFVGPAGGESVEVLVPTSKVAVVLHAISNGDAMSIVPTAVSGGSHHG